MEFELGHLTTHNPSFRNAMIAVHYFQRNPAVGRFSIERLFHDIRSVITEVPQRLYLAPCSTVKLSSILRNLWFAYRHQGAINHVVGDTNYQALALPRQRCVLTIHDFVGLDRAAGLRGRLIRWLWYQWPIAHARFVTVISEQTRRELFKQFPQTPPEKVHVIPNCIGEDFFQPVPQADWPSRPVVLHVGEKPNKNLERVIESLAGLNVHLRVLGSPDPRQCQLLTNSGLEFSITGRLPDAQIISEYRNCHLVCFPSLMEGFGLPILEAQAVGRPLITSQRPPMSEICGQGGALLVNPEQTGEIRQAVQRVLTEPQLRESLVQAGRENAARYRPRRIAEMYLELYQQITPAATFHFPLGAPNSSDNSQSELT